MALPGFKAKLKEVNGTITTPYTSGLAAVLNLASIDGQVDSDLEQILMKRWSGFKNSLRQVFVERVRCKYGNIHQSVCTSDVWVFSLYCLNESKELADPDLKKTFKKLKEELFDQQASLHVSKLLLDKYPELNEHISDVLTSGINVFVYNEPVKEE
jgi:hypothetical protein